MAPRITPELTCDYALRRAAEVLDKAGETPVPEDAQRLCEISDRWRALAETLSYIEQVKSR